MRAFTAEILGARLTGCSEGWKRRSDLGSAVATNKKENTTCCNNTLLSPASDWRHPLLRNAANHLCLYFFNMTVDRRRSENNRSSSASSSNLHICHWRGKPDFPQIFGLKTTTTKKNTSVYYSKIHNMRNSLQLPSQVPLGCVYMKSFIQHADLIFIRRCRFFV